jgi:hypothetical protein
MRTRLLSLSTAVALVLGFSVAWVSAMPSPLNPAVVVGGFCKNSTKCDNQFDADCLGTNCPAGTKHKECSGGDENSSKTCTINGNCNNTAGCDAHDDCTCS